MILVNNTGIKGDNDAPSDMNAQSLGLSVCHNNAVLNLHVVEIILYNLGDRDMYMVYNKLKTNLAASITLSRPTILCTLC